MSTIRRNVVSYLYVVHCSIDGKKKKAFVQAESDAAARSKALNEMMRDHKNGVNFQVLKLERIDTNEDCGVSS